MPGINRTGLPNSADTNLGRGAVFFATLDTTTGKPAHFRHLGNCIAFAVSSELETLQHFSSRSGIKKVDREVVLSQKLNLSITLDEATNFENLSLWFSGSATKDTSNAARTTVTNKLIHADAIKGRSYELVNASNARLYDINAGSLVVRSGGASPGTTLLAQGTDYTVDSIWGTIFLPSTSAHVDGDNLWFTYTAAATEQLVDVVDMLTTSKVSGFLRFKSINAANSDKQMLVDFHSVSLKAEGDLNLIGEEFTELVLTGVAEANETGYPTAPVGRIYYHTDA